MHLDPSSIEDTDFKDRFAHFLTRTTVSYATDSIQNLLTDRGIENRLMDSLLAGLPDGAVIAGGFMTSVLLEEATAKDIDVFFLHKEAFAATVNLLLNPEEVPTKEDGEKDNLWAWRGYELKGGEDALNGVNNCRFLTFIHTKGTRPDIQLLRMVWYEDAEHVIDSFDLTIAQIALSKRGITYRPSGLMDLVRKRLVSHRVQFPASTLRRVVKYAHKGFYACPGSLAKICEQIQEFKGDTDVNEVVYVD